MDDNFKKYIKTYCTYKDLFGKKYDKARLIKFIKNLPLNGIFDILSQLAFIDYNDRASNEEVTEYYIKHIDLFEESNTTDAKEYMQGVSQKQQMFIYSPQSLLTVWKWLLAYGDEKRLNESIDLEKEVCIAIYLSQIVSDYNKTTSAEYELFRNAVFNSTINLKNAISRANFIYIDIAQKKELFNKKEYIDFNDDFKSFYKYSLEEYMEILLPIASGYISKANGVHTGWKMNFKKYFSKSLFSEKAEKVVELLSANFEEY